MFYLLASWFLLSLQCMLFFSFFLYPSWHVAAGVQRSSNRSFGGLIWMIPSCRDSGLGCRRLIQQLIRCHGGSFHHQPCQRFPLRVHPLVNYFTSGFALNHIWWVSYGSTGSVSVTVVCNVVLLSNSDSHSFCCLFKVSLDVPSLS